MIRASWVRLLITVIAAGGWLAPVTASQQPGPQTRDAILFVGSSIFHRWTDLEAQMAPLPVLNRAVDGLQTADLLRTFDSLVRPYQPRVVVYYCGSNDVGAGEPAQAIFDRIRLFVERVHAAGPNTRVVFVSINRAPEKMSRWNVVDAVNDRVNAYAREIRNLTYVDVNPALFKGDGTPRYELYMPDQLHLRPAAYEEFARIIKPVVAKAFNTP